MEITDTFRHGCAISELIRETLPDEHMMIRSIPNGTSLQLWEHRFSDTNFYPEGCTVHFDTGRMREYIYWIRK